MQAMGQPSQTSIWEPGFYGCYHIKQRKLPANKHDASQKTTPATSPSNPQSARYSEKWILHGDLEVKGK